MFRKTLVRVVLVLLLLVFIGVGVAYWLHIHTFVSTDDAYVYGYVGVISARVPGRVARVAVDDNQFVKPGQVLLTLEPQDYETALAQAQGNLGRLRQEMAQDYVKVSTSRAKLAEAEANFKLAITDKTRYSALFERHTVSRQTLDTVNTRYRVNQALVDRYKRELQEAEAAIGGSTASPIEDQPTIKEARAKVKQARLNLEYTEITAKLSGYITRRQVEVGNWVQPGQPLMMLVPLNTQQLWVQSNYKETELTHVYIGQPATVRIDTYPGVEFKGRVDSIMAGTGSAFSLLPPENATGNWVKVVQRIPVKVTLLPPFPDNRPLRIGMSAEVTIDTRKRTGKRLMTGEDIRASIK
ncbi:MAG: HlyD family secretion protein [Deltaproteobacteria bacterium]|nr:HlyD family secretion protein [Deltaproteobacteria bacterium]